MTYVTSQSRSHLRVVCKSIPESFILNHKVRERNDFLYQPCWKKIESRGGRSSSKPRLVRLIHLDPQRRESQSLYPITRLDQMSFISSASFSGKVHLLWWEANNPTSRIISGLSWIHWAPLPSCPKRRPLELVNRPIVCWKLQKFLFEEGEVLYSPLGSNRNSTESAEEEGIMRTLSPWEKFGRSHISCQKTIDKPGWLRDFQQVSRQHLSTVQLSSRVQWLLLQGPKDSRYESCARKLVGQRIGYWRRLQCLFQRTVTKWKYLTELPNIMDSLIYPSIIGFLRENPTNQKGNLPLGV